MLIIGNQKKLLIISFQCVILTRTSLHNNLSVVEEFRQYAWPSLLAFNKRR